MFKRELKINYKSLIIWVTILLGMYVMIYAIYPNLMNDSTKESLMAMMNSMPKEMLETFNMDIVGIEDAFGWFKTEGYTFLVLIGSLYSAILGSTILIKEESDKTIEFLISKPVSRNNIVTSKIMCGVLNIIIFTLTITLGNFIALRISGNLNIAQFFMVSLLPLILYLMMFFITLMISTLFRKTRKSMTMGIALVFIAYFMQIIGGMGDNIKFLKDISLFEFASSRYIILNNSIDWVYVIIGIIIITISAILTYRLYNKKEFL